MYSAERSIWLKERLDDEIHADQGERLLWHGFPDESCAVDDVPENANNCFWDLPGGGTSCNPRMEAGFCAGVFLVAHGIGVIFFAVWQGDNAAAAADPTAGVATAFPHIPSSLSRGGSRVRGRLSMAQQRHHAPRLQRHHRRLDPPLLV